MYNDKGERGYICLAFSGSHYDVLIGISGAPSIPKQVKRRGLDRNCLNWNDIPVDLRRYSFDFVWKWPTGKAEMHVINELTLPPSTPTSVVSSSFSEVKKKVGALNCAVCGWVPKKRSKAALNMHRKRSVTQNYQN